MKKKTISIMIAAAMLLTAVLAGTAAAGEPGYTANELTVAIWDNNQLAGLQQIADEWSETSGVKVNINVINWNEYWTLLSAGAMGGQLPDVFWMHINEIQQYMDADMLLNLDDYIAADDKIDLSNYYEGIVDLYSSNGSQYALPKDHDTIAAMNWLAEELIPMMPSKVMMSESDPDLMFLSGMAAMMMQGSWMVNTFYTAEYADNYAWSMIPYYDANGNGTEDEGERCSLYNGLGWAAAANTADPQAAYDLSGSERYVKGSSDRMYRNGSQHDRKHKRRSLLFLSV